MANTTWVKRPLFGGLNPTRAKGAPNTDIYTGVTKAQVTEMMKRQRREHLRNVRPPAGGGEWFYPKTVVANRDWSKVGLVYPSYSTFKKLNYKTGEMEEKTLQDFAPKEKWTHKELRPVATFTVGSTAHPNPRYKTFAESGKEAPTWGRLARSGIYLPPGETEVKSIKKFPNIVERYPLSTTSSELVPIYMAKRNKKVRYPVLDVPAGYGGKDILPECTGGQVCIGGSKACMGRSGYCYATKSDTYPDSYGRIRGNLYWAEHAKELPTTTPVGAEIKSQERYKKTGQMTGDFFGKTFEDRIYQKLMYDPDFNKATNIRIHGQGDFYRQKHANEVMNAVERVGKQRHFKAHLFTKSAGRVSPYDQQAVTLRHAPENLWVNRSVDKSMTPAQLKVQEEHLPASGKWQNYEVVSGLPEGRLNDVCPCYLDPKKLSDEEAERVGRQWNIPEKYVKTRKFDFGCGDEPTLEKDNSGVYYVPECGKCTGGEPCLSGKTTKAVVHV
jgi:hypothetical protein